MIDASVGRAITRTPRDSEPVGIDAVRAVWVRRTVRLTPPVEFCTTLNTEPQFLVKVLLADQPATTVTAVLNGSFFAYLAQTSDAHVRS